MSADLHELLTDAARLPAELHSTETTWAAGQRRRRRRRVASVMGAVVGVVAAVTIGLVVMDRLPVGAPFVDDLPRDATSEPTPQPTVEPEPGASRTLADLPFAVTELVDGGPRLRTHGPTGVVDREPDGGPEYPGTVHGMPDGTVVWQHERAVRVLPPDADEAWDLVAAEPVFNVGERVSLVGVGELEGRDVVLVEIGRARSLELQDDEGSALYAIHVDGSRTELATFPAFWEEGVGKAELRFGYLLYSRAFSVNTDWYLRAPDGSEQVIAQLRDEGWLDIALVEIDAPPGVGLVVHRRPPDFTDPIGIDVYSVDDPFGEVVASHAVASRGVPKAMQVVGEAVLFTLYPDEGALLEVHLPTGEVTLYEAAGPVVAH